MKLLIITQSIDKNNPILGFFHRWVEEFAKHFEKITIICLQKGDYDLPQNVKVLSLGKEKIKNQKSKIKKIKYIFNFYKYIWNERKNYDLVFVHMNPIYVILGGIFWRLYQKKIGLWYTHKNVDTKLAIAEKITNFIFTASKESFRIKSKKVHITGHGIDTDLFKPANISKENIILSVGRISKTKRIIDMLDTLKHFDNFKLQIIGLPVTNSDKDYSLKLKQRIKELGLNNRIEFIGNLPQNKLPEHYNKAKILLNLSETGSLDKIVLEAMSVGLPIVTTNDAFSDDQFKIIPIFVDDICLLNSRAESLIFMPNDELNIFSDRARNIVIKNHSLSKLINKLYHIFNI